MYYDYPIEQLARSSTTRFQMGFARMTMHLMPQLEDVVLEPSTQGLKILGAHEMALEVPGEIIRQIHANDVELRRPRVRLRYDTAVREPIMWVRAAVDGRWAEPVVRDLIARNAEIEEVDWRQPVTIVRAKAPLARLLGYRQALSALVHGTADLKMWLSHYETVAPGGGDDAA